MADSRSLSSTTQKRGRRVITLAGFLTSYGGRIREACGLDLRQLFAWCAEPPAPAGDGETAKLLAIT